MNIDLLKRLCETPGAPGHEDRVRALIEKEVKGLFDDVHTDPMGSLHCVRKARGSVKNPKKIMLLCHMDEIAFLVSYISKEGYIYVDPIGGFDRRNLFSRRVKVCTPDGDYKGVMNPTGKPVHIQSPEEAKKIPEMSEFFIEIGHGAKVAEMVQVGDYVVMDEPFFEMGDKIVSKALDNRVACWLGIEAVRQLENSKQDNPHEIHVVFTTQEEVGLRGAKTSAHAIAPDIAFGIDVTLSCDTPGVPEHEAVTVQGKGFGLHVKDSSFISDIGLLRQVEKIAKDSKIPFQRTILPRGGQDGAAAQQAAAGAKAVGIVVGTRYIHTVTETLHKSDLEAARNILATCLAFEALGA